MEVEAPTPFVLHLQNSIDYDTDADASGRIFLPYDHQCFIIGKRYNFCAPLKRPPVEVRQEKSLTTECVPLLY